MKHYIYILSTLLVLFVCSCIKNDVPYPVVEIQVLKVEGEGFTVGSNDIDLKNRIVTLRLDETTDINKIIIKDVSITEGGKSSAPLTGTFDLQTPMTVTLSLYQDYDWTFTTTQEISRTFKVEGQIGDTEFDLKALTATVNVPMTANLKQIKVMELKLGPKDITIYDPKPEELTNFNSFRYVNISYNSIQERWKLYVKQSEERIGIEKVDLWANTATMTGIVTEQEYATAELQYRLKGSEQWQTTQKGAFAAGAFSAQITPTWRSENNAAGLPIFLPNNNTGIFAGQSYELRLVVGEQQDVQREVTTSAGDAIPDGNMESGKLSCFTNDNATSSFWGSGNNTFASSLCRQGTYTGMQGSFCAKMSGTSAAGVLASGNLFSGIFYKAGLTTGVVEFGQPFAWSARPTALKVKYYAEKIGIVDIAMHKGAPIKIGDQDKGRIMVAIVDWNTRHKVTSGTSAPSGAWDPTQTMTTDEGKIIAYGSMFIEKSSTGETMIEVSIPLNYYDKMVKPSGTYTIVLSCATSAYGDFMVGCKSNILFVDDFKWEY